MAISTVRVNSPSINSKPSSVKDFISVNESKGFKQKSSVSKKEISLNLDRNASSDANSNPFGGRDISNDSIVKNKLSLTLRGFGNGQFASGDQGKKILSDSQNNLGSATAPVGASIGYKNMILGLLDPCSPGSAISLNLGALGLLPGLSMNINCSTEILSTLLSASERILRGEDVSKVVASVMEGITPKASVNFLKDAVNNKDTISFNSTNPASDKLMAGVIAKSDLDKSHKPDESYKLMDDSMGLVTKGTVSQNDETGRLVRTDATNSTIKNIAVNKSLDKTPTIDLTGQMTEPVKEENILAAS